MLIHGVAIENFSIGTRAGLILCVHNEQVLSLLEAAFVQRLCEFKISKSEELIKS
jgi:hypothetical protein